MLTYEERHYAAKGFISTFNSKRTNKKSIGRAALKGGAIGLAGGAALGIAAKGISNRRKGEKFFKGTGKAALVGGSVGAVAGAGVGAGMELKKQGNAQTDALNKAKAKRSELHKGREDKKQEIKSSWDKHNMKSENPFVSAPTKKTEPEPKNSTTPHDPYAKSRELRIKAKERSSNKAKYDEEVKGLNSQKRGGLLTGFRKNNYKTSSEIIKDRKLASGHVPTNRGDDKAKESDTKGTFKGGLAGGFAGNIVNVAGKSRARVRSRMSNLFKGAAAGESRIKSGGSRIFKGAAAGAGFAGKSKSKAPEVNFSYYGNGN